MFNRRIKLPTKEVDRASVECLLQLWNNIVWCGLSSGVVKVFDLSKSTAQEVHASKNVQQTPQNIDTAHVIQELVLHSDRISCLVEVREHVWSSSYDTTIVITQAQITHGEVTHSRRSVLRNHKFPVTVLVNSDIERRVYSADSNGIVIEWSDSTQCVLRKFTVAGSVSSMASTNATLWLGLSTGIIGVDILEAEPNTVCKSVFVSTGARRGVCLNSNSELLVRLLNDNDADEDVSLCSQPNLSTDTSLSDQDDDVHPALVMFVADVMASNATALGVGAVESLNENGNADDNDVIASQKNGCVSPFPQDQDVLQGCTAVAMSSSGELWVGGWGFLQVWEVANVESIVCRVHWKIGQRVNLPHTHTQCMHLHRAKTQNPNPNPNPNPNQALLKHSVGTTTIVCVRHLRCDRFHNQGEHARDQLPAAARVCVAALRRCRGLRAAASLGAAQCQLQPRSLCHSE
eukprot:m.201680 g.201680  ORF g.201680 m.201680 type:complete len:461 (-) comp32804_c3_seq6:1366-2748(-)